MQLGPALGNRARANHRLRETLGGEERDRARVAEIGRGGGGVKLVCGQVNEEQSNAT